MAERQFVSRGDPIRIKAGIWNDLQEMANWWHGQKSAASIGGEFGVGQGVLVKNDTGSAVAVHAVMGIGGVLVTPATRLSEFQQRWSLSGVAVSSSHNRGQVVVASEPIPSGKIGRGIAFGISPVQVAFGGTTRDYAIPAAASANLSGSTFGLPIVYKPAGTGTEWCLVSLGLWYPPAPAIEFTLSATLAQTDASKSATVTASLGFGAAHSGTVTVKNTLIASTSTYKYHGASGARGIALWESGTTFRIIDLDCP